MASNKFKPPILITAYAHTLACLHSAGLAQQLWNDLH